MPRIGKARDGAEPTSAEQRRRQVRILEAATRLGSEHELARVQMTEVAKCAGVAIGTLYRYFPSKTHLFVALLLHRLELGANRLPERTPGMSPRDAITEVLIEMTRRFVDRPRLAAAMLLSNSTASAAVVPDSVEVRRTFLRILFERAGLDRPTDQDRDALRLLSMLWSGLLVTYLNGGASLEETEEDVRSSCELLLAHLS
ncbi:TetR family transcriptional regulator [Rhodococcus sp. NPDC047139]|uniref:TetR family transcriptional regulator n=1 Tax=Rhodococcus sp. NPDC047139 TaxID=3155141 RepID=UPI0033CFADC9